MSAQHELVVDLDKNEITLNGMYLGNTHNVEVRFDHSPWGGGSATITLHQVTLTVPVRSVRWAHEDGSSDADGGEQR